MQGPCREESERKTQESRGVDWEERRGETPLPGVEAVFPSAGVQRGIVLLNRDDADVNVSAAAGCGVRV